MDRQEKMKAKEGSENGSENGSNDDSDTEDKVSRPLFHLYSSWFPYMNVSDIYSFMNIKYISKFFGSKFTQTG